MGTFTLSVGEFDQARSCFFESLAIFREVNDSLGKGLCMGSLGRLSFQLGQYDQAEKDSTQALALFEELGSRVNEGQLINDLGQVAHARENLEQAQTMLQERAAKIKEGELRRSFLENVAENREFMALFESSLRVELTQTERSVKGIKND